MSITKKILEEAVLDVLYAKSIDRPLWVNASEVYWSLPFADVSEREVTAMLTELVEEQRVKLYLGKYQLSKEEQVRLKEQAQEREQEERKAEVQEERMEGDEVQKPYQEQGEAVPPSKPRRTHELLAVFLLGLVLGGLSWWLCSSMLFSETSSWHHQIGIAEVEQRLGEVETRLALQGYFLMLAWVLLLAIGGVAYYRWKHPES